MPIEAAPHSLPCTLKLLALLRANTAIIENASPGEEILPAGSHLENPTYGSGWWVSRLGKSLEGVALARFSADRVYNLGR